MNRLITLTGTLILILGTAGCGAWHQTPRISNLSLTPQRVLPGTNATTRLSFYFEDPSGEIVIGKEPQGGCTFVDGDREPTTFYRVGRQVFLRVTDPDNDTSSNMADVLYGAAWIEARATGDRETVVALVETGPNTGIFEGPVGGFPLVGTPSDPGDGVLSARDRDILIAVYQDPNDPGDVCIALAKLQ